MRTVLLVEDEGAIATSERLLLERCGYAVATASSGEQAIEIVGGGGACDLVLIDLDLGHGLDGPSAARKILKIRELPLIFLSSRAESAGFGGAEEVAHYGYVTKDSGPAILDASIKTALRLFAATTSSASRLGFALDAAKAGIWEWDLRTNENLWSDELWGLYGLGRRGLEPSFETWLATIHPDDREKTGAAVTRASREGVPFEIEWRVDMPGGRYKWLLSRGKPSLDENGRPLRYLGIVFDVSEIKRAEEALKGSESLYRSLFENMLDGFAYCRMIFEEGRPSDFVYLTVNAAFEHLTGLSGVVGRKVSEVIPGIRESDPDLFELYGRVSISGQPERRELFLEALGQWFLLSVYSPMAEHFVALFEVITDRKLAEYSLAESEEKLGRILSNSGELICEVDAEGRYTFLSGSYSRILGYSPEELLGKSSTALLHPEDLAAAVEKFSAMTEQLETTVDEWRFLCKDGRYRSFECRGSSFVSRDGSRKTVVVSHEIADRSRRDDEPARRERRLRLLVDLLQHQAGSVQEFMEYALDQAIQLTESGIGYVCYYDEDRREFTLNAWSKGVAAGGLAFDRRTCYGLDETDIWGEAVRQRRSVVVNDYGAQDLLEKDFPEGHARLEKFMTVPLFSEGRIIAVVGLANKKSDYDEDDVLQTALLMSATWKSIERMRAQERIEALLAEKEMILKEVHHRIKNNMNAICAMLSLQGAEVQAPEAVGALAEAGRRVWSMMLLYQKLYESEAFTELSIGDYLSALADDVVENFPCSARVSVEKDIQDFTLDPKRLQAIGIIVNELLTNALKYAFVGRDEGRIAVKASLDGGRVGIFVADDGGGLPAPAGADEAKGFGLTLVRQLAIQLRATLRIENDGGAAFSLEFDR